MLIKVNLEVELENSTIVSDEVGVERALPYVVVGIPAYNEASSIALVHELALHQLSMTGWNFWFCLL